MKLRVFRIHSILSASIYLSCAFTVQGADVIKSNNTDNLNLASSWGGTSPGTGDYATWDATVTGTNTVSLGENLIWGGIKLISPAGTVTIQAGNALTISGGLGTDTVSMGTATQNLTLNHDINLGAHQTWNIGGGITLAANGAIGGIFTLTKAGSGTLALTGANGYSGGTTLTAGTISFLNASLGSTGAITMNGGRLLWAGGNTEDVSSRLTFVSGKSAFFDTNGNNVTLSAKLSGTFGTTQTLTKFGAGTLTLSGSNDFTGGTTVQGGTLKLDYSQDVSKLANGSKLTLKGGTLELSGGNHIEEVFSTELYSDNSAWGGKANTVTRTSGSAVLQMNAISRTIALGGSTINFAQAGIATTDTNNTNGIIGGWATVGGIDWAASVDSAADNAPVNAYAGYTDDTWAASLNTDVTLAGSDPGSGSTTNSLRFNAAGSKTLNLSGINILNSGGLLVTSNVGPNATAINGGTLTAIGGSDLVIHQHNTQENLTIGSIIANNGTNIALTKSGAGTLVLTTATTHGGGTYINAGVLRLKNSTANTSMLNGAGGRIYIASEAALEFENGTSGTGGAHAFQLSGTGITNGGAIRNIAGNNSVGGAVTLYADSRINSDSGTLTLSGTVANSASWETKLYVGGVGNVTFSNNVTGGLTLIKDGSGTLTLNGTANTYSGGTIISAGTLSVSAISRLSPNGMVELAGGKLQYSGSTAAVTRNLRLNAASGNSIDVSSPAAILTNSGVMDGPGGFAKTGPGTLELNSANLYTGKTTVSEGTLKATISGSLAASHTIEVQQGAAFDVSAASGFTLGSTQAIQGTGNVIGAMTIAGTLSPGSSLGTLATDSQIWANGGNYNWQVYDATGIAGSDFDNIAVNGTLDLSALTAGGFSLNLWTLQGLNPDASGNAINFDNAQDHAWTLLSASGGITGFEASDFAINPFANNGAAGFSNGLNGGTFSLTTSGDNRDLILSYTAVPEPSSFLLCGLGSLLIFRRRR